MAARLESRAQEVTAGEFRVEAQRFYEVPFSTPLPDDPTKEVFGVALWFEKVPTS